ncbi:MAG: NB-ARC domain-containing protein [Candidatus Promineifilaceae bacterium]
MAYLVLEAAQPLSRAHIANVLWAGYERKSGRASLRMTLSNLRRVLGPFDDLIVATRNTIQFRSDHPDFWCDVLYLQQFASAPIPSQFDLLIRKYDRILLVGFDKLDSLKYVTWLAKRRQAFADLITTLNTQAASNAQARHNLPRSLTTMFGRSAEIHQLKAYLTNPDTPLVTLLGPGGVGKTTLALAAARQLTSTFPDGVWFVPLDKLLTTADHNPAEQILHAIAHTLNVIPHSSLPLKTQLVDYLAQQKTLLILDNFEQVQGAAPFVLELLATTQLTILVTSRQRLHVMPEQIVRLYGLPVPTRDERDVPSVALFCDRLRRIGRQTSFDEHDWLAIGTICRTLNGLPLGIELAAIACEHKSPQQLQQQLAANLDVLQTEMVSFPERQRNLWSVVEYAWQMLSREAQRVLLQCALLCGTFSAETLTHITQARSIIIQQLVHNALLTPVGEGMYQMHAQLRAFCEQKTAVTPALRGWVHQAKQRHAAYYLTWVAEQLPALLSQPVATIESIRQQLDQLEQAWCWSVDHYAENLLVNAAPTLGEFFRLASLNSVGVVWLQSALAEQFTATNEVILLTELVALHCEENAHEQALDGLRRIHTQLEQHPAAADVHFVEGCVYHALADHANSIASLQCALVGYREALSAETLYPRRPHEETLLRHRAAQTAHLLGRSYVVQQVSGSAELVWDEGQQWALANKNTAQQIDFLHMLSQSALAKTDYQTSLAYCEQAFAITDDLATYPQLYYYAGISTYELGEPNKAQLLLQTAIRRASQLHQSDIEALALLKLGQAQLETQQVQAARRSAYLALGIGHRIGQPQISEQSTQLIAQIKSASDPAKFVGFAQNSGDQKAVMY